MKQHQWMIWAGLCTLSGVALGHARWSGVTLPNGQTFKARSNADNLKTGPCGGLTKGTYFNHLVPGSTVNLRVEETINHPGGFTIDLSRDEGVTWTVLTTLLHKGNTPAVPRPYDFTLSVPSQTCDNGCILRMRQHMTDSMPARDYFSCADVKITTATPPPSASPSPSPSPSPAPVETKSPAPAPTITPTPLPKDAF